MKKLYFLFFLTIGFLANAQIVNIPDSNFKARLLGANGGVHASTETPVYYPVSDTWGVSSSNIIDTNGDGEIQVSEAQAIKFLNVYNGSIYDLQGISSFTNLEFLNIN